MSRLSAREMLHPRGVGPTWARLWGLTVLMSTTQACLLPADQVVTIGPSGATPPEVDLRSLDPREGRIEIARACSSFVVEAGAIWDEDDEALLLRWVANNGLPFTREVRGSERTSAPLGEPRPSVARIDPQFHFPEEFRITDPVRVDAAPTGLGILSLFVTDAPEWQDPKPDLAGSQAVDLSLITAPGADGGELPYSVVEVRWGVLIGEELTGCPQ